MGSGARGLGIRVQITRQVAYQQLCAYSGDALKKAVMFRFDIEHDLVGLDGDHGLALGNTFAVGVCPFDNYGIFHREAEFGNRNCVCHASISRTLAAIRLASG